MAVNPNVAPTPPPRSLRRARDMRRAPARTRRWSGSTSWRVSVVGRSRRVVGAHGGAGAKRKAWDVLGPKAVAAFVRAIEAGPQGDFRPGPEVRYKALLEGPRG